jgi:hypothetical protein
MKNAIAHAASRRMVTMAAMTPPEIPCDFSVPSSEPARTEPEDVFIAAIEGMVVLPELVAACVVELEEGRVGVEVGGGDGSDCRSDDGEEDESMMSEELVAAERVELSTVSGRGEPSGITSVTTDVETSTTVVGVGVSPTPEADASVVYVVVCTAILVVTDVESAPWSSTGLLLKSWWPRPRWCPAPG